jgi:hypothetical protein
MPSEDPEEIIRPKDVRRRFIPLGKTQLAELVKAGHLEAVPLSPGGRAKGITKRSVVEYQRRVMGLGRNVDADTSVGASGKWDRRSRKQIPWQNHTCHFPAAVSRVILHGSGPCFFMTTAGS